MACPAGVQPHDRDLFHCAANGVPETNLNAVLQIGSRLLNRPRGFCPAATKELAEEIAKARPSTTSEVESTEVYIHSRIGPPAARALLHAFGVKSELVVHLALLRIGKNVVSFLDFFEFFFRGLIAGI